MKIKCFGNTMRTEDGKYICVEGKAQSLLTWSDFLVMFPEIEDKILTELGYAITEDDSGKPHLCIKDTNDIIAKLNDIAMNMKHKLQTEWLDIDGLEPLSDNFVILNKEDRDYVKKI